MVGDPLRVDEEDSLSLLSRHSAATSRRLGVEERGRRNAEGEEEEEETRTGRASRGSGRWSVGSEADRLRDLDHSVNDFSLFDDDDENRVEPLHFGELAC